MKSREGVKAAKELSLPTVEWVQGAEGRQVFRGLAWHFQEGLRFPLLPQTLRQLTKELYTQLPPLSSCHSENTQRDNIILGDILEANKQGVSVGALQ